MAKKQGQFKKPDTPYKIREDGFSYAQLIAGPWHGLWVRVYDRNDHEMDMAGDIYRFTPHVGHAEGDAQADYVHVRTEVA